ncbi:acyltransferase family protein [Propionivibrio soli]|uniref:acyltransferase family protein n=1 Tax=Propionivibrio soli TaxID=2976531 RepID=UPI0021E99E14|nr:acyltransferase [Propionivibrio soli]
MSSANYVIGIDRLRAIAALSVLLAHVVGPSLPGLAKYIFTGYPAVVAFFVISGFCIHAPYVKSELPCRAFWLARFIRISIPAAIAWPLSYQLGLTDFNPVDGYILWSIVCELWYYALYPVFLFLHRRWLPFSLQWAVAFVVAYGFALWQGSDQYGSAAIYGWSMNWIIGLPSWLIGCALAERGKHSGPVVPLRFSVAIIASFCYWATMNTAVGFYLTGNLFAILCAAWISSEIAAAKHEHWLDRIGKWSYSIYLFHILAWIIVFKLLTLSKIISVPFILISVPFILLGCYIFYRLIEQPSHKIARQLYRKLAAKTP